jgi:hypothetical protein
MQMHTVMLHSNILGHKSAIFTFCLSSGFLLETAVFVTV